MLISIDPSRFLDFEALPELQICGVIVFLGFPIYWFYAATLYRTDPICPLFGCEFSSQARAPLG
jgi:hypothetical protein